MWEQELRDCWVVVRIQSGVGENDFRAVKVVTAGWAGVRAAIQGTVRKQTIPEVWVSGICAPCTQGAVAL